ncbi:MAG TPA: aminoglycoside phosphotransferase family protein, partial [Geminicoccaceae bacterium]|nr:aminoglycoside phosphotransferase family protein [Geminicoccaceae bacterium]
MSEPLAAPILRALGDPEDRLLARSILGTDDAAAIAARVDGHCRAAMGGTGIASVDFVEISTGAAFGLTLGGGRRVFQKAWSPATPAALLRDAHAVQAFLAARGYPCAAVLVGPRPFGAGHAAIHEYRDDGDRADASDPPIRRGMAAALARLVELAAPLRDLEGLPRWMPRDALWGAPHNALFDFEATRRGAEWIERIAAASRGVLLAAEAPMVIGHRDWSARNMRFGRGGTVSVVYDWDSLAIDHEAAFVGKTAVAFPMTWYGEPKPYPSPDAAAAFVRDYEAARGRRFGAGERVVVAAAATYALTHTARCEHARDPAGEPAGSARRALPAYAP